MATAALLPTARTAVSASPFACFGARVAPETDASSSRCRVVLEVLPDAQGASELLQESRRLACLAVVEKPAPRAILIYGFGSGAPVLAEIPLPEGSLQLLERPAHKRPPLRLKTTAGAHAALHRTATVLLPQLVALLAEVEASQCLRAGAGPAAGADTFLEYSSQGILISYTSPDSPKEGRLTASLSPNTATGCLELRRLDPQSQSPTGKVTCVAGLYGALAHLGAKLPQQPPGCSGRPQQHGGAPAPSQQHQSPFEGPHSSPAPLSELLPIREGLTPRGPASTSLGDTAAAHLSSKEGEPFAARAFGGGSLETLALERTPARGTPQRSSTAKWAPSSSNRGIAAHPLSSITTSALTSDASPAASDATSSLGPGFRQSPLGHLPRSVSTDPHGRSQREGPGEWGQRYLRRTITTAEEA